MELHDVPENKKQSFVDMLHMERHREKNLLGELLHAHQALLNLFSREVGISPAKLKLFHEFLHAGPDGIGVSDLALHLGVTPALITRQVKELEKEGWVQRRSDSRDGRRTFVFLSEKGKGKVLRIHERAHRFEADLFEDVNPEEIAAAVRVLSSLSEKLESLRKKGKHRTYTDREDHAHEHFAHGRNAEHDNKEAP